MSESEALHPSIYDYLLTHPTGPLAKEWYRLYDRGADVFTLIEGSFADPIEQSLANFIDWTDDWPGDLCYLFAHALNSSLLAKLGCMVDAGLMISEMACYNFCVKYPQYALWKELCPYLKVKSTVILGAYDYDEIPFTFYRDMIEDLGEVEIRRAIEEDSHMYDCRDVIGYINQIKNETRFKVEQQKGIKCPTVDIEPINVHHH